MSGARLVAVQISGGDFVCRQSAVGYDVRVPVSSQTLQTTVRFDRDPWTMRANEGRCDQTQTSSLTIP